MLNMSGIPAGKLHQSLRLMDVGAPSQEYVANHHATAPSGGNLTSLVVEECQQSLGS